MRVLLILFFSIILLGFLRKKINEKYEFIHYLLQITMYVFVFLFVYILGMHFLGNSI